MDGVGGSEAPEALAASVSLGSLGNPRVKGESKGSLAQIWETQWKAFLKTVEGPQSGLEMPHLPEEPPPWDDANAFLAAFEQVAEACQWPKNVWVARLLPALSGVTAQAFSMMEFRDREDYEKVKAVILQGIAMSREKTRQHFRHFCYQEAEGPSGAYSRLEQLCHQWLKPKTHSKEQILELLILEQFVSALPPEIQSWVKENNPESSARAVLLAEEFFLKQQQARARQQQLAEPQAKVAVNLQAAERAPSDHGQMLQLYRETKQEADLGSPDHRNVSEDKELNQPQENSKQTEPQTNKNLQHSDVRESSNTLLIPRTQTGSQCEKSYVYSSHLKRHQSTHTADPGLGTSLSQLRSTHTANKPYKCLECGKDFDKRPNLIRHGRVHTGERPYKCPDCGKNFMWNTSLSVHRKRHAGEKPALLLPEKTMYICCEYGDSFNRTEDFGIHQLSHVGEKPCAHTECAGKCHYKQHLGKYQHIHTLDATPGKTSEDGEKPFKCPNCGKLFMEHSFFERHRKIHTGEKPAVCKGTYTRERKCVCSVCEKGFFKLWHLRRHQRIHTGERPYKCSDCGEHFMWMSSLKCHRRNHAKGRLDLQKMSCVKKKSHICSECGKSLKAAAHLRRHQRIHTGERPYKCNDCGGCFMWKSSLVRHKKLH